MSNTVAIREKYEYPKESIGYLQHRADSIGEVNTLNMLEYISRLEYALAAFGSLSEDAQELAEAICVEAGEYWEEEVSDWDGRVFTRPDPELIAQAITARDKNRDELIRRECAEEADKALASEGYDDYENSIREFVRAAIIGREK